MGDRLIELLIRGMERLRSALTNFWKRYTAPPTAGEQRDTYTDQW